tara:strand:+ start:422 stop:1381 length:960 start_codon:yes stop_codon:yes gene_type:complete
MDITKTLTDFFDRSSENWTNRSHDYPKIDQASQFEYLNNLKNDYITASKEKQTNKNSIFAQYIADLKAGFDGTVELKDEVSMINNSSDLQDNNWNKFKSSPMGQSVASILNGDQKAVLKDGNLGYDINTDDGETKFMTIYDIKKLVNENVYDSSSKNILNGTMDYVKTLAMQEGNKEFDVDDIFFKIKNEIVKKGNKKSLIFDTLVPTEGGSFYMDLINKLEGTAYEALGITEEMLKIVDTSLKSVNIKDGINREEATIIADELIKNKDVIDDYITNYFTMYMKNQFDKIKIPPTFGDRIFGEKTASDNNRTTIYRKSS